MLVSGGHTHIYRLESPWRCLPLGRTLDDAAGEAFDKVGKLLGLAYPGGRLMDALATAGRADAGLFRARILTTTIWIQFQRPENSGRLLY